jgi:hypothetical protein
LGTLIDSSVFIAAERGHPPSGTMVALADLATGEYLIAEVLRRFYAAWSNNLGAAELAAFG